MTSRGDPKNPQSGFYCHIFLFLLWGQTIIKHLICIQRMTFTYFLHKNFSEGDLENQLVIFLSIFIFNRTTPYVIALVVAKFLHTFGLYVTYEQLKVVHVVQFLFIVRLWYVLPRSTSFYHNVTCIIIIQFINKLLLLNLHFAD